jgi:rhodanese-related sulfurtransferase
MTAKVVEPPVLRMARLSFEASVRRDAANTPVVTAEFLAEQGQYVRIVDVREPEELLGALGHIPAVTSVPMSDLAKIPEVLAPETLLVLVSGRGRRASIAAHYLEALGMRRIAALDGGMEAWKKLGFSTPRDPTSLRRELRRLPPGVARDGRPLLAADHPPRLSAEEILAHVGEPGAVRWVKLAAFLLHGKRSCVDGRDDKGVIGTPGGDAGEFLLALSAAEVVRNAPLTDEQVEGLLLDHLDTFGRFYLHSDTDAMNTLILDGLRRDERITPFLEGVFHAEEWREFHKNPPEAVREALLEHLVLPQNMGCGHMRLALIDPAYGVREGLSRALLRAFHRARWSGAPEIEWVVLGGDHVEGAVIEVVLGSELHSYTRIPLVSPQVDGLQMFVSHPEVTAHLRRETASFLVEAGIVPPQAEAKLLAEITARGERQMAATLTKLAAGLPIFRLHFPTAGRDAPSGTRPGATIERVGTVS